MGTLEGVMTKEAILAEIHKLTPAEQDELIDQLEAERLENEETEARNDTFLYDEGKREGGDPVPLATFQKHREV